MSVTNKIKEGKVCNKCNIFKYYNQFSICNKHSDKRQYCCIDCYRVRCKTKKVANYSEINGEQWKYVVGYEGFFSCSNFGRIRSESRVLIKSNGVQYTAQKRILYTCLSHRGYPTVCISKNGSSRTPLVHRLIAIAFLPNLDKFPEVNHIDGNKTNSYLTNLE